MLPSWLLTPLSWVKRGVKLPLVLSALLLFSLRPYFVAPIIPSPSSAVEIYSNQTFHDLQKTVYYPIEKATKSILVSTFGEFEPELMALLKKRAEEGIKVFAHYDAKSFPKLEEKTLGFPSKGHRVSGLMHQKVLIVDESFVYLGSTNFTMASYKMHDNLLVGFFSPSLAEKIRLQLEDPAYPFLIEEDFPSGRFCFFSLPGQKRAALDSLVSSINNSKESIQCHIFTFTHLKLCDALVSALRRNVRVEVTIDKKSRKGASKQVIELLSKNGAIIRENNHQGLMHHKMCLIDEEIFYFGSANWTKSAFEKNRDYLVRLDHLSGSLKPQLIELFEKAKKFQKP
ncbi:MAG: phospholipase D-like domain-containing protein [Chlamydiia bacterium]